MLNKRERDADIPKPARRPVFTSVLIFVISCCSPIPAFTAAVAKPAACNYRYYQDSTEIDGHKMTTEYYVPEGRGSYPLVFMLHGSAGAFSLRSKDEPLRDNFGEKSIAHSCFVVVLPHYLEALGLGSLTSEPEMVSVFPLMLAITGKLLSKAESLPSTRKEPVFLFGESLGGYLSIALSLRRQEVIAVSEMSAGIPAGYLGHRLRPLAMLISHGADDDLVSENEAEKLQEFCVQHHFQNEMDIYPTGHYFEQVTELRCIARTIEFFRGVDRGLLKGRFLSSKPRLRRLPY